MVQQSSLKWEAAVPCPRDLLVQAGFLDPSLIYLTVWDDSVVEPLLMGDFNIVVRPSVAPIDGPMQAGGGNLTMALRVDYEVSLWVRLEVDEQGKADAFLGDASLGIIQLVSQVFKALNQQYPTFQQNSIVVGGTPALSQTYAVTIGTTTVAYTASSTDTNVSITSGLLALLQASTDPGFQAVVWTTGYVTTSILANAYASLTQTSAASGTGTLVTTPGTAIYSLVEPMRFRTSNINPKRKGQRWGKVANTLEVFFQQSQS